MRPAPRYRRACWASAYRFCVAQPCPRLHEAFHLERVTAQSGRQESGSHIANVRGWFFSFFFNFFFFVRALLSQPRHSVF